MRKRGLRLSTVAVAGLTVLAACGSSPSIRSADEGWEYHINSSYARSNGLEFDYWSGEIIGSLDADGLSTATTEKETREEVIERKCAAYIEGNELLDVAMITAWRQTVALGQLRSGLSEAYLDLEKSINEQVAKENSPSEPTDGESEELLESYLVAVEALWDQACAEAGNESVCEEHQKLLDRAEEIDLEAKSDDQLRQVQDKIHEVCDLDVGPDYVYLTHDDLY